MQSAVMTLSLVQEILPPICAINSALADGSSQEDLSSNTGNGNGHAQNGVGSDASTTSQHYAIIESDHPYKPAAVANFKVIIICLFIIFFEIPIFKMLLVCLR